MSIIFARARVLHQVSIDDIASTFDGHNCPALRGIPRLFIIQACQGGQYGSDPSLAPVYTLNIYDDDDDDDDDDDFI